MLTDKYEYSFGSLTQQYIAPYRKKKILSEDMVTYKYTLEESFNQLSLLNNFLKERNIRLVIFNYFTPQITPSQKIIEDLYSKYEIRHLNLNITYDYYEKYLRLKYDDHPSKYGELFFAEKLYYKLINGNYITNN